MGSSARRYGIWASQGQEPSNELTARTLLIPCINVLGLTTHPFFLASVSKPPEHAYVVYLQHLYTNVCLGPRASNSLLVVPYRFLPTQVIALGRHRLPRRIDRHRRPASSWCVLHLIFQLLLFRRTRPSGESDPYRSKIDHRLVAPDHR